MNRITERLASIRLRGGKALALFLTAGYPRRDSSAPLALGLAHSGADIIELGMPFSDPLADGPVIQKSSAIALALGITLKCILEDVRVIRSASDIPVVLMGYLNPILKYGTQRFFEDAAVAGVDGVILPELPLEEAGRFAGAFERNALAQILLVTPTTPPDRIAAIDAASHGFLYCVSSTGVTGGSGRGAGGPYIRRVKAMARKNPVLVGFGIATPEDARRAAAEADGVIIGSALIRRLIEGESLEAIQSWVRSVKRSLSAD